MGWVDMTLFYLFCTFLKAKFKYFFQISYITFWYKCSKIKLIYMSSPWFLLYFVSDNLLIYCAYSLLVSWVYNFSYDIDQGTRLRNWHSLYHTFELCLCSKYYKIWKVRCATFNVNNWTECLYCSKTDHPSYKCIQKPACRTPQGRKCYWCISLTHTIKDCPHADIVCYRCGVEAMDIVNARRKIATYKAIIFMIFRKDRVPIVWMIKLQRTSIQSTTNKYSILVLNPCWKMKRS